MKTGQVEESEPVNAPTQHFLSEQQAAVWVSALPAIKDSTPGERISKNPFELQEKMWSEPAIKHEMQILGKAGLVISGADGTAP